jgi:protein-S-isoprenylcysteine O-methyltransferase Ste14
MSPLSPAMRIAIMIVCWIVWILGLVALRGQRRQKAVRIDPRARWGLGLQMAGYFLVCAHEPDFWISSLPVWRAIAGIIFALFSIVIFRAAVANLGPQWRFDAGLNRDHELVQTGAYRVVRHPIYASMLGMLLMDVCLAGTFPAWPVSLALFLAGTEIRVRVEDDLLRGRFGERFTQWQRSVPAYLPFIR